MEFVFAPAERDVYSCERIRKVAPLGAKQGRGTVAKAGKRDSALNCLGNRSAAVVSLLKERELA